MRHPVVAALVLLAVANVATAATLTRGPYLQLLTTHSVTVVWNTDVAAACSLDIGPPGGAATTITGGTGTVCAVSVDGLATGTYYDYAPNADGLPLVPASEFRTDDPLAPTTLLVFGDSGDGSANQMAVRDRMLTTPADAIIHTGDMIYDDGAAADFDPKYFTPYAGLLRHLVLWPCLGNHDVHPPWLGQPWKDAFYTRPLDSQGQPVGNEVYYSFDVGNAHVVVLNSNGSMSPGAPQLKFLTGDLAASTATWKFVVFHHSVYSSGTTHGSDLRVRAALVPIFDTYGVDVVLMGHEHDYERTYPMVGSQIVAPNTGTVYFTTGGGGNDLYPVGQSTFTAYSESVLHFMRLVLDGGVLTAEMIDADGNVHDSTTIVKGPPFSTTTTSTSTSSSTSSSVPTSSTSTSTSTTSTSTSSSTSTTLLGQTTTTSTSHTTSSTTSSSTTTSSSSSTTSTTHINVTTSSTTTTSTHPVSTTTSSSSSTTSTAPGATTSSSSTSSTSTSSSTSTTSTSTSTSTSSSTSTTSTSSSSSTTTETTASTTTTVPAPLCTDSSCADTDPCTIDSCDPVNGCRHNAIGISAVMASIETSLVVDTCAGQVIPRGLSGSIARARERIQSAAVASPRLAHRLMLTAIRRLHAASHRADVARRQGRISAACAETLRSRLDAAANQAGCL